MRYTVTHALLQYIQPSDKWDHKHSTSNKLRV